MASGVEAAFEGRSMAERRVSPVSPVCLLFFPDFFSVHLECSCSIQRLSESSSGPMPPLARPQRTQYPLTKEYRP